jgi:magnesium transporter
VEIGEVMVFVGPRYVVTVRHGQGSPLHDVRLDLETHPDLLGIGPSSVLYAVADRIVDDYATVIEGLAVDIEQVEEEVFSGLGTNAAERIYKLKREVLAFKRAVAPLVDPMERPATKQAGLPLDPRTGDYCISGRPAPRRRHLRAALPAFPARRLAVTRRCS